MILNSNDGFDVDIEENVGFPCFVKPNQGGSSLGISRVDKIEDLRGNRPCKSTNCESIILNHYLRRKFLWA